MAIHNDLFPQLQTQLQEAHTSSNDLLAAELTARIAQESEKRQRWAVRLLLRSNAADFI